LFWDKVWIFGEDRPVTLSKQQTVAVDCIALNY